MRPEKKRKDFLKRILCCQGCEAMKDAEKPSVSTVGFQLILPSHPHVTGTRLIPWRRLWRTIHREEPLATSAPVHIKLLYPSRMRWDNIFHGDSEHTPMLQGYRLMWACRDIPVSWLLSRVPSSRVAWIPFHVARVHVARFCKSDLK